MFSQLKRSLIKTYACETLSPKTTGFEQKLFILYSKNEEAWHAINFVLYIESVKYSQAFPWAHEPKRINRWYNEIIAENINFSNIISRLLTHVVPSI